jgi:alkylated DNA repair dioxygenase AlkB
MACVSLGSDMVMDFKLSEEKLHVPVHVPARSLWVISGEARWKWTQESPRGSRT